ncbi:MAG: glycosyltransferase [bacterium]|nr:glycosyltransferase [bacterium]
MKRIMIFGIGPISIENSQHFHAGGNRAWHLAKPLLDEGFEVVLLCMRITGSQNTDLPLEEKVEKDRLTYYSVDEIQCFAQDEYLHKKIAAHHPDALVGACGYPAARAAAVAGSKPVWADIHGYPMGEAQAKAYHYNEPGYLHHFWNIHRDMLRRSDRFSVTSERQRMALIGELGTMGRLNGPTFCEPLVHQIPIAWDPETPFHFNDRHAEAPFTVFFSGGYNLWCDIETLFYGVEKAMRKDPRIRFLSTGGAIDGHDEKTYPKFQRLVEHSEYKDRFELKGWVPKAELETYLHLANLGINTDLPCYESLIGARNRITEWMARGIPVLTTLATEISQILFYKGLVLTVPMQDPDLLANEILLAANRPDKMKTMAEKARQFFESTYTFHATTIDFVEWCKHPVHSRDFGTDPVILDYRYPFQVEPASQSRLQRFAQCFRKQGKKSPPKK